MLCSSKRPRRLPTSPPRRKYVSSRNALRRVSPRLSNASWRGYWSSSRRRGRAGSPEPQQRLPVERTARAAVGAVAVLALFLRHSAALAAGLGSKVAVLGKAARLGRDVAAAFPAGFRGQLAILGEAALLARDVGAALAGKLTLL